MTSYIVHDEDDNNPINSLLNWVIDAAVNGFGPIPSAEEAARHYRDTNSSIEDAINSLIGWRTTYGASVGFVTGLGGLPALPFGIAGSLASSYALGASTAATIACLRGYNPHSNEVKTLILLCLIGEAGEEILRQAGIQVGKVVLKKVIQGIPGKVFIEINKKVGFRLMTKAGEKGIVNLMKFVPIAGGIVGAAFDGIFVNLCGGMAKKFFPSDGDGSGGSGAKVNRKPKNPTSFGTAEIEIV